MCLECKLENKILECEIVSIVELLESDSLFSTFTLLKCDHSLFQYLKSLPS